MTAAVDTSAQRRREASETALDVERIRGDFPILAQRVNDRPLTYLDNAASAQKPRRVLDALHRHYANDNANIHRGVHALSVRATAAYEGARVKAAKLLNAERAEEIVFVRGATEAINLVAQSCARPLLKRGDEIVITTMEHHSNIVPWQMLCEQTGAVLRVAPINDKGELELDAFETLLGPRTKIVAVAHISNAIGTINPVAAITELAHKSGAVVLVDGAQAVPHGSVDVRALDCDFYTFSGHKFFGPTGVGVLYGKAALLEAMAPYQGGGEMIRSVTFEKTTYNDVPHKFEAGTPNIAGVVGLGAAIDYVTDLGIGAIETYEKGLLAHATRALAGVDHVRLIGTARDRAAVLSFVVDGVHPHDVGTILDQQGIAIRTGHHCAQPLMDRFGVPATCRASLAFYNTTGEVDVLVAGLQEVVDVFS